MDDILKLAQETQNRAWAVIKSARVMEAWKSIGAEINLIGSLKTRLLIRNLDIDFHIYTSPFVLVDSFKAIATIANNQRVKRIKYVNLLDTNEKCLEWHAWYQDSLGAMWQIDMIHILYESPFAGKFERIAERVSEVLTEETKRAILSIKNSVPEGNKVKGIEVNMAVIRDGIRTYSDFIAWTQNQQHPEIIDWEP